MQGRVENIPESRKSTYKDTEASVRGRMQPVAIETEGCLIVH